MALRQRDGLPGKDDVSNAQKELKLVAALAADTTLRQLTVWGINTTADLAQIASKVLAASIAANQKNYEQSIMLYKQAVAIEDNLNYNEPPDWFFSVRHHLGAVLLKAGKYSEAEKVYQNDLLTWKKNGWALIGLYNSLLLQGRNKDAQACKNAFNEAWKYADLKITSSSSIIDK